MDHSFFVTFEATAATLAGIVLLAIGVVLAIRVFVDVRRLHQGDKPTGADGTVKASVAPIDIANLAKALAPLMRTAGGIALVVLLLGVLLMSTGALGAGTGQPAASQSAAPAASR